jgi:hypothetical protein
LAAVKMPKNQSSVKIELQTFCILNSIEMESPTLKKKILSFIDGNSFDKLNKAFIGNVR